MFSWTGLSPSDVALILDFVLAIIFATYFAFGAGFTWTRDPLGWVIFGYAIAVVALLGLIVYGIALGQTVAEPLRFIVGSALGVALLAKTRSVYLERRKARNPIDTHPEYEEKL